MRTSGRKRVYETVETVPVPDGYESNLPQYKVLSSLPESITISIQYVF